MDVSVDHAHRLVMVLLANVPLVHESVLPAPPPTLPTVPALLALTSTRHFASVLLARELTAPTVDASFARKRSIGEDSWECMNFKTEKGNEVGVVPIGLSQAISLPLTDKSLGNRFQQVDSNNVTFAKVLSGASLSVAAENGACLCVPFGTVVWSCNTLLVRECRTMNEKDVA
eukprot:scaffold14093_cov200-Alexandrium_tamarense.AAC.2